MAERWWENFPQYTQHLLEHLDEMAGVCRLALELEPDLSLLAVDFMSTDHMGHLGFSRWDPEHPAHDPAQAGDELIQVYERADAALRRADRLRNRPLAARSRPSSSSPTTG